MLNEINEQMKLSLKSGDKFKLSVLRMLKSAIQNESINKKKELIDEEIMIVLKKQVKMRKDSLEEYKKYNKIEEVENLEKEINILSVYLPVELSKEETEKLINEMINELKPLGQKDMGKCMKYATENFKNVDMALVSSIIKEKLSQI